MNVLSGMITYYKEGGPFMHFILACAVFVIAIVVERIVVIGRAAALDGRKMADEITSALNRGDHMTARRIATGSSAPVARVAAAMLHSGPDEESCRAAADDAATLAMPSLAKRISHLGMLANVATLLGLLGTIFGLTTAFIAVGAADPAQRSAFLAAGIAQALNATTFGLMVAIPALLAHAWLVGMVEGVSDQVDEMSIRLGQALSRATPNQAATGTTGAQIHSFHPGR